MPVMTIRAKPSGPSRPEDLVALANAKASDLLDRKGERVLVVYGKQQASIYYEGVRGRGTPKLS